MVRFWPITTCAILAAVMLAGFTVAAYTGQPGDQPRPASSTTTTTVKLDAAETSLEGARAWVAVNPVPTIAPTVHQAPTVTLTPSPVATATPTLTPVPPAAPVTREPVPSAARGTVEAASTGSGYELLAHCGRTYPDRVYLWATTAATYGWNLCEWANIVDCESDGDEWVSNPSSGACGVMQHLPCAHLGDGYGSIALGYAKYQERGWQPWTVGGCYPY